jgi:hypothetical protein
MTHSASAIECAAVGDPIWSHPAQHGQQEIPPLGVVHPRGAQDDRAWKRRAHGHFSAELGCTIDAERPRCGSGKIRRRRFAVEHEIRGEVYQPRAVTCGRSRHVRGTRFIDRPRLFRLAFGAIHRRVSGGIDDGVGTRPCDVRVHRVRIDDVEVGVTRGDNLDGRWRGGRHGTTDLAARPGQQHFHGNVSATPSTTPA